MEQTSQSQSLLEHYMPFLKPVTEFFFPTPMRSQTPTLEAPPPPPKLSSAATLRALTRQAERSGIDLGEMIDQWRILENKDRLQGHSALCVAVYRLKGIDQIQGISDLSREIEHSPSNHQATQHKQLRELITKLPGANQRKALAISIVSAHLPYRRQDRAEAVAEMIQIVNSFRDTDHGPYLTAFRALIPIMRNHGDMARALWSINVPKLKPEESNFLVRQLGQEGITPPTFWE